LHLFWLSGNRKQLNARDDRVLLPGDSTFSPILPASLGEIRERKGEPSISASSSPEGWVLQGGQDARVQQDPQLWRDGMDFLVSHFL
jgi:hypothetical protein